MPGKGILRAGNRTEESVAASLEALELWISCETTVR